MARRIFDYFSRFFEPSDRLGRGEDAFQRHHTIHDADISALKAVAAAHAEASTNTLPIAAPAPEDLPLKKIFTNNGEFFDFNWIEKGQYDPAYYYNALGGNDTVYLPDALQAAKIGYDAKKFFFGASCDDVIGGNDLDDLIDGGQGNDQMSGLDGNDVLIGGAGNDRILGGNGVDLLYAGTGRDVIHGNDGDDFIIGNDDDGLLNDTLDKYYEDVFYGDSGNDIILASSEDHIHGGIGNDVIVLATGSENDIFGQVTGDNGDDTIIGSDNRDFIYSGTNQFVWVTAWDPGFDYEETLGGFHDKVDAGGGDDYVATMIYCEADVNLGDGNDMMWVYGKMDHVDGGRGNDTVMLFGGACEADLGLGDDILDMARPSYNNPNVSLITLGQGKDTIQFSTDEWGSNYFKTGESQSFNDAPLILDFDAQEDVIGNFKMEDPDWPELALKQEFIKVVGMDGGSAIVYDDVNNANDFCFVRFKGVDAADLQANFDQNATFISW